MREALQRGDASAALVILVGASASLWRLPRPLLARALRAQLYFEAIAHHPQAFDALRAAGWGAQDLVAAGLGAPPGREEYADSILARLVKHFAPHFYSSEAEASEFDAGALKVAIERAVMLGAMHEKDMAALAPIQAMRRYVHAIVRQPGPYSIDEAQNTVGALEALIRACRNQHNACLADQAYWLLHDGLFSDTSARPGTCRQPIDRGALVERALEPLMTALHPEEHATLLGNAARFVSSRLASAARLAALQSIMLWVARWQLEHGLERVVQTCLDEATAKAGPARYTGLAALVAELRLRQACEQAACAASSHASTPCPKAGAPHQAPGRRSPGDLL